MTKPPVSNIVSLCARPRSGVFDETPFDGDSVSVQGLAFESHVVAEPVSEPGAPGRKQATVRLNHPLSRDWSLQIDSGYLTDTNELAPSSLGYLSVGLASCLLTQVLHTLELLGLTARSVRVEQRLRFHTTDTLDAAHDPAQRKASTQSLDACVVIDSDASDAELHKVLTLARQASFAFHAMMSRVPANCSIRRADEGSVRSPEAPRPPDPEKS